MTAVIHNSCIHINALNVRKPLHIVQDFIKTADFKIGTSHSQAESLCTV